MDARNAALEIVGPLIRAKARRLARRACFSGEDVTDIEQDLAVVAVKGMNAYSPERGLPCHLLCRAIRNGAATLVRDRSARKRMPAAARVSLDSQSVEGGEATVGDQIHEAAHIGRLGTWSRSPAEQVELALDLEAAVASLPDLHRDLCARLPKQTIAEISRETGVTRSTIAGRVRTIRQRFEDCGLRDYLPAAPTFRTPTE